MACQRTGLVLLLAAYAKAQTIGGCPVFPSNNIWNARVDSLRVHASSAAWVNSIGPNATLHQDFGGELYNGMAPGIPINLVTGAQPKVAITINEGHDESDPGPYPFPPDAKVEDGSDRHVLVVDTTNCMLYETFYSFKSPDNSWTVYSGAIFDLRRNLLRPRFYTSADAAGLPIMPGLARYEEILEGEIKHALRFTAPQTTREFLWPARHFASFVNDANRPSMGARFRLKTSFDISTFSPTTRIILTALKRYGMMLADNGSSWYMQGTFDTRWPNLADEWRSIPGSAFEAVDTSDLIDDNDSAAVRGAVAAPILDNASFLIATVTGGQGATLRVGLTGSAPAGGLLVALASANTAAASIASTVLIPEGFAVVNVPVTTSNVALQTQVVLTATLAGIVRQATLTVNPSPTSQAPVLQSVTPSSGNGDQASFVIRTSDGDGASDVARVDILVGPALDSSTGCHVVYNIAARIVYLRYDNGSWAPATPGSPGTLTNLRCSLDASQVTNSPSGTVTSTFIPIRFTPAFRGNHQVFVRAYDQTGLDTSWRILGGWSVVPPEAPVIRSLSPASGSGDLASFAAGVSDSNGASDVARVDLLVGPSLNAPACHVSYNIAQRRVYLKNTDGSWQAAVPGSPATLANPRCSLDALQVANSISGNQVSGSIPLRFNSSFTGIHNVYVRAYDAVGLDSSWVIAGLWGVGITMERPQVRSFTPSSGSGDVANFVAVISDANGASNLSRIEFLAGPALDTSGCHAVYNTSLNILYLRNVDGSWLSGTPGSAGSLANSRCSIDLSQVTRSVAEPALSLTIPMRFSSSFTGNHTVYLRAANRMGLDTTWLIAGSWSR